MKTVAIALLLILGSPAPAQQNGATGQADDTNAAPDPDLVRAQKDKALAEAREAAAKARTAEYDAEAAAAKARFAFLPQSPAEGKVTLGEGAGATEAAMLTTIAIQAAAARITTDAAPTAGTLLIGGNDPLDLSALLAFQAEATGVEVQLKDALGVTALVSCNAAQVGPEFIPPAAGAAITALAGMLRTDTELRSVKTDLNSEVLARAVAAKSSGLIVPKYRVKPAIGDGNVVACTLKRFDIARQQVQAKLASTPPPAADAKARLEAAAKRSEDFYQAWTKPADDGTVRLAAALAQAEMLPTNTKVLRVHLDHQGGSLLTRRNLWTALGAKAIAVSGGVVASFTLDDPFTGKIEKSGVYVCGTTLADFRRIQRLDGIAGKCVVQ